MQANHEWAAPCGLYCGVCGILIAHRDDNAKFKEKLADFYGVTPDQVRCKGCLSDEVFVYCRVCPIKSCNAEKGYEGCHQCPDFPCDHVSNFPMAVGKAVILRSVPFRREHGDELWMADEEKRARCPHCGAPTFRGAKRCGQCKEALADEGGGN